MLDHLVVPLEDPGNQKSCPHHLYSQSTIKKKETIVIMSEVVPRKRTMGMLKIPIHILLQALLFVCVLSLRDVIKDTLDRIPIPKTNILWMWMQVLVQISIGFGIITIFSYYGWADQHNFING
jgi:hypothetical protein